MKWKQIGPDWELEVIDGMTVKIFEVDNGFKWKAYKHNGFQSSDFYTPDGVFKTLEAAILNAEAWTACFRKNNKKSKWTKVKDYWYLEVCDGLLAEVYKEKGYYRFRIQKESQGDLTAVYDPEEKFFSLKEAKREIENWVYKYKLCNEDIKDFSKVKNTKTTVITYTEELVSSENVQHIKLALWYIDKIGSIDRARKVLEVAAMSLEGLRNEK